MITSNNRKWSTHRHNVCWQTTKHSNNQQGYTTQNLRVEMHPNTHFEYNQSKIEKTETRMRSTIEVGSYFWVWSRSMNRQAWQQPWAVLFVCRVCCSSKVTLQLLCGRPKWNECLFIECSSRCSYFIFSLLFNLWRCGWPRALRRHTCLIACLLACLKQVRLPCLRKRILTSIFSFDESPGLAAALGCSGFFSSVDFFSFLAFFAFLQAQ